MYKNDLHNDSRNCLGCSLIICVAILAAVYLFTHIKIILV